MTPTELLPRSALGVWLILRCTWVQRLRAATAVCFSWPWRSCLHSGLQWSTNTQTILFVLSTSRGTLWVGGMVAVAEGKGWMAPKDQRGDGAKCKWHVPYSVSLSTSMSSPRTVWQRGQQSFHNQKRPAPFNGLPLPGRASGELKRTVSTLLYWTSCVAGIFCIGLMPSLLIARRKSLLCSLIVQTRFPYVLVRTLGFSEL
mmetsp:Transcript_16826/g.30095  ORF Transcript_16826/g.30095 Transcript_16826/m.30095 type:complete len:201 (+) Transcript_16826:450-1052(+)